MFERYPYTKENGYVFLSSIPWLGMHSKSLQIQYPAYATTLRIWYEKILGIISAKSNLREIIKDPSN
jgi:hypothetical protein